MHKDRTGETKNGATPGARWKYRSTGRRASAESAKSRLNISAESARVTSAKPDELETSTYVGKDLTNLPKVRR